MTLPSPSLSVDVSNPLKFHLSFSFVDILLFLGCTLVVVQNQYPRKLVDV